MKGLNSEIDEWSSVVNAQHLAIKRQDTEERKYSQLNKLKYREELDQQMELNKRLNKSTEQLKRKEFEYHQNQGVRFKDFDSQVKNEQRNYCKSYIDQNAEVIKYKKLELDVRSREERGNLEEMIRKSKYESEVEKRAETEKKQKRKIEQQAELDRLVHEADAKKRFLELERQREREQVSKKIFQMEKNENKFQEFYDQKLRLHEEKLKKISPHFSNLDPKQVLIQKRLLEYDELSKQKHKDLERIEQIKKIQSINLIKQGLDFQLHSKQEAVKLEKSEGKKYQDQFKKQALEEEYYRNLGRFTKNLEKYRVKEEYDKQVLEKRSASMARMRMDGREKEIHSKMLENIDRNNVFPCVPGLHSSQSPSKNSFDNIYSKQRLKRDIERIENSGSNKQLNLKNEVYWTEVSAHNPIINPIGASVPKVIPGQRMGRGVRSENRENVTVKDLFSGKN